MAYRIINSGRRVDIIDRYGFPFHNSHQQATRLLLTSTSHDGIYARTTVYTHSAIFTTEEITGMCQVRGDAVVFQGYKPLY